jgi:hypothetical protein
MTLDVALRVSTALSLKRIADSLEQRNLKPDTDGL